MDKINLEVLRNEVADAVVRAYGAERRYAVALCEVMPAEWYLMEASDTSEVFAPVRAEKKAFYAVLKAAKHSNPSTVWARVRKYGQEHMEGSQGSEGSEGEGSEGEGSDGARTQRSIGLRLIEELTRLYKACQRENAEGGLTKPQQDAFTYVASALGALGVDISTL